MTTSDRALDNALRQVISLESPPAEHPNRDTLREYYLDRLAPEQRELLLDHLSRCPACAGTYLDLEASLGLEGAGGAPEPVEPFSEVEREAAWQRLRAGRISWWRRPRRSFAAVLARPGFAYGLAALFLASAIGLAVQSPPRPDPQPTARLLLWDLIPESERHRTGGLGADQAVEEVIPRTAETERIVLLLNLPKPPAQDSYEVRILDRDSREIWRGEAAGPSRYGSFAVELPATFLPAGAYRVLLYRLEKASEEEGAEPIAVYRTRLEPL